MNLIADKKAGNASKPIALAGIRAYCSEYGIDYAEFEGNMAISINVEPRNAADPVRTPEVYIIKFHVLKVTLMRHMKIFGSSTAAQPI